VHDGFLFFHKVGLLFVQKFLFIPKSEVRSIDFTGATGRTFDLQVQTKARILREKKVCSNVIIIQLKRFLGR
jgi:hypothetical protein